MIVRECRENRACFTVWLVGQLDDNNRILHPKEETMYPWHYLKDLMNRFVLPFFFILCVFRKRLQIPFAVRIALEIILKMLGACEAWSA